MSKPPELEAIAKFFGAIERQYVTFLIMGLIGLIVYVILFRAIPVENKDAFNMVIGAVITAFGVMIRSFYREPPPPATPTP